MYTIVPTNKCRISTLRNSITILGTLAIKSQWFFSRTWPHSRPRCFLFKKRQVQRLLNGSFDGHKSSPWTCCALVVWLFCFFNQSWFGKNKRRKRERERESERRKAVVQNPCDGLYWADLSSILIWFNKDPFKNSIAYWCLLSSSLSGWNHPQHKSNHLGFYPPTKQANTLVPMAQFTHMGLWSSLAWVIGIGHWGLFVSGWEPVELPPHENGLLNVGRNTEQKLNRYVSPRLVQDSPVILLMVQNSENLLTTWYVFKTSRKSWH